MSRLAPLQQAPFTIIDGGLSTVLEELGEQPRGLLWTASALLDRPEVITAAHRRYVDAGADIVISSSYQASEDGFVVAGVSPLEARRLLASTTDVARASGAAAVAASVGPFGACLGDGSEYHGRYDASWGDVRAFHRRRLEVLVDSGPDLYAIETIPTAVEALIVAEELRALTDAPAWLTFSCRDEHRTCGGDVFAEAVADVAGLVDGVGVNCTAPGLVASLLSDAATDLPLVVYPNHGAAWDAAHRCWIGPTGGAEIPALVPEWWSVGARFVGGCCGVGSAGIRALHQQRTAMQTARG
jgi:homocysteine S-methyltransferase